MKKPKKPARTDFFFEKLFIFRFFFRPLVVDYLHMLGGDELNAVFVCASYIPFNVFTYCKFFSINYISFSF